MMTIQEIAALSTRLMEIVMAGSIFTMAGQNEIHANLLMEIRETLENKNLISR